MVGGSVVSLGIISVLQFVLFLGLSRYSPVQVSIPALIVQVFISVGVVVIVTSVVFYVGVKALNDGGDLTAITLVAILGVFPTLLPQLVHLLEVALVVDLPGTAAKLLAVIWSLYIWSEGLNALVGIGKVAAVALALVAAVPFVFTL